MPKADLLVTVHSGTQGVLGIIGMKALQKFQTDQPLEGFKEILIALSPGDIKSGGIDMGRYPGKSPASQGCGFGQSYP